MHDLGSPLEGYMKVMVTQMLVSMSRSLRDDDLTLPQLASLHLLDVHKEMRIGEIAAQLLLPLPAASRVISGMVKRGLVRRREDASDRRAKIVSLSQAGLKLIEAISRRRIEEGTVAMMGIDDSVSEQFNAFLGQLVDTGMTRAPEDAEPQPVPIPDVNATDKPPEAE